jgi:2,3-bisphosphoglycerate-independent phosphoglycerate mutase
MSNKAILIILDGWGIGDKSKSDVIYNTPTPNIDKLCSLYPSSLMRTSGEDVGLPDGQMGNSEVGHLNIGAGRVVYQDLVKINKAVGDNSISQNPAIIEAYTYAKANNKKIHLLGLLSDGGVHSMDTHAHKLCDIAKDFGIKDIFVHCFMDGRDTDPKSGLGFMKALQSHLPASAGKIASVVGRYYAMDRDKNWDRIKLAYDLLVEGKGEPITDPSKAIESSYADGITDEFLKPMVCVGPGGKPIATIEEGDVVICYNYRTDRLRQMTTVLSQKDMPEAAMKTLPLKYYTMTRYDDSFTGVNIIYDKDNLTETFGEVLEKAGKTQIRIAETEKYAHVTFFFSGGRETEFNGERRLLVPSPKVATYDLKPEMSAIEVTDLIVPELEKASADFVCLNFANGDMVGHTGDYTAIQKAITTVDSCVGRVVEAARKGGYEAIIIADHGNADFALNPDGSINTAHTTNPVPCILVSDRYKTVKDGILADVAPTLCQMMGLQKPAIMTGSCLV